MPMVVDTDSEMSLDEQYTTTDIYYSMAGNLTQRSLSIAYKSS